jgi:hypothetical protein
VLGLFGPAYALHGAVVLLVVSLAVFPQVAKLHAVALARVHQRLGLGILLLLAGGALEVALTTVGAVRGGIGGAAGGWLAAVCLEGVVVLPSIVRAVRRGGQRADSRPGAEVPERVAAARERS